MPKPPGRSNRRAGTLVLATLLLALMGSWSPAGAQPSPRGTVSLESQDPWLENQSNPVRLRLDVRSAIPVRDLLVSVALYTEPDGSSLASRDEFDATLAGDLAGLQQLPLVTFSLSSINDAHGYVDLYAEGSELPGHVPGSVPPAQVFQLSCPADYGGCGGVYPLQVSLVDVLTGQSLNSFTTYLVVLPPSLSAQYRLRFAFVVPVGTTPALGTTGAPEIPAGTLAEIEDIAGAEARWKKVPVTIDLYGQVLLALARSPKPVKLLNTVSYGGLDSLVAGPFSAVDPTQLVRSGLGADLASQLSRGTAVFSGVLHTRTAGSLYVATGPLGPRGLAALAADGISRVVVPDSDLQSVVNGQPSTVQWPYTLSAPFSVSGTRVEGLQADPGLAAHLEGRATPALRAQQLMADLAEIFFDSPDFPSPRGVALVAPTPWTPQPGFLSAVLKGLSSSPIVDTVPLSTLFSTVPKGSCQSPPAVVTGCSAAVRTLAIPQLTATSAVSSGQVQAARTELKELTSVIPSQATTLHSLSDSILLAESSSLGAQAREAYLSAPDAFMARLGSQVGLPAGRTVTVTSTSARVPIAITSSSRIPMHALLVVSGPDLTSSRFIPVVLRHGTTSFIVRVQTRTSGDSRLQLQLLSPSGHLQIARAELTIRSTAISGVAIALTVGAVGFLVVWWLRSAGRRRRRRAKHALGQLQVDDPVGEPAS